jgi:hypothetical protein
MRTRGDSNLIIGTVGAPSFAGVVKGRLAILAVADSDFGYACSVKIALRIASETRACYGP